MGRKNKGKASKNTKTQRRSDEITNQIRELADQLLRICSSTLPSGAKLWEEHKSISSIIERINTLEENVDFPLTNREDQFSSFLQWVKDNGVDIDAFSIEHFNEESWGLKAEVEVEEGKLWLAIPRKIMITSSDLKNSNLADILKKDPITKSLPQVLLTLFILQERLNPQSKFKPYLDILPTTYDTVLYFTVSEFEELKGCFCLDEALVHYRHIVRQYAYYWQLFSKVEENSFILKHHFTFNSYRWAVSTVMTRQNAIPNPGGADTSIALVPLWDMCNHSQGRVSTDFSLDKDELQCYADRRFTKGDQIFISYGERPNREFFIYNAFVCQKNPNDRIAIKLGISKNDPSVLLKASILQRMGINQNDPFNIVSGANPLSERLLTFVRIFTMEKNDLSEFDDCEDLKSLSQQVLLMKLATSTSQKAWTFLKTRLELLLKSYKTTLEEDEVLLKQKSQLSSNRLGLAVEMRLSEKRILHQAVDYINSQCKELEC